MKGEYIHVRVGPCNKGCVRVTFRYGGMEVHVCGYQTVPGWF